MGTATSEALAHFFTVLYIVKSLVEAHGGNVSVASTAEAGTVFTVRLPRVAPLGGEH